MDTQNDTVSHYEKLGAARLEYAVNKGNRTKLEDYKKIRKAELMQKALQDDPKLPQWKAEINAYIHPDYKEIIDGLAEAVEKENYSYWVLREIEIKFEAWRTNTATKRAEASIR